MNRVQLELDLQGNELRKASIRHGLTGTTFTCSIGHIAPEQLAALEGAARRGERVLLRLPEPVLLEALNIERAESDRVRITGRIVNSDPAARGDVEAV